MEKHNQAAKRNIGNLRVVVLSSLLLCASQSATGQAIVTAGVPKFNQDAFSRIPIPPEIVGAWQMQIEGKAFKLRNNFNIEIKITNGKNGTPEALVSYFAGNPQRPSSICRSQLSVVSVEAQSLIFQESLNYRAGKDACPIWKQVAIEPRQGQLMVRWRDGSNRKNSMKMEALAYRSAGGQICRTVGGKGAYGGQVFCRTSDGDWLPKSG